MNWDKYYMNMCDAIALKSKDNSTNIGAIIVGPRNEVRSIGYNDFPRGVIDSINDDRYCKFHGYVDATEEITIINDRRERPLKYKFTEHAERNAIYNAAAEGIALKGCKIYVNKLLPCSDCARAIIQSGITAVVVESFDVPDRWKEDCDIALLMFKEASVNIKQIE